MILYLGWEMFRIFRRPQGGHRTAYGYHWKYAEEDEQ